MPLKKPKKVPSLPKLRSKTAESVMEAIPDPKPDQIEYICKIFYRQDKGENTYSAILSLETITEFTNFIYEISTELVAEKREINLIILGLNPSTNSTPGIEPAHKEIILGDLVGENKVNIYKRDGAVNSAVLKFNPFSGDIKILNEALPTKKNNRRFCRFELIDV